MKATEKITINAHSSVKIDNGDILRIDPFLIKDEPHDADIIFVTHSHGDHFSIDDINKVKKENTVFVIPESIKDTVFASGILPANTVTMLPAETKSINGYSVTAVPSYNTDKPMHKKEYGWLGYNITVDGCRIYIAGDTDATEELIGLSCDVAIIPIGGTYTMNFEQAAFAINKMKPSKVIPSHYGSVVGTADDGKKFADLISESTEVCLMI